MCGRLRRSRALPFLFARGGGGARCLSESYLRDRQRALGRSVARIPRARRRLDVDNNGEDFRWRDRTIGDGGTLKVYVYLRRVGLLDRYKALNLALGRIGLLVVGLVVLRPVESKRSPKHTPLLYIRSILTPPSPSEAFRPPWRPWRQRCFRILRAVRRKLSRKPDDVIIVVLRALDRASATAEFPSCLAGACESPA